MRGAVFALALLCSFSAVHGDSVPSLQRQLAAHVNQKANGVYEAPDPPMGGTHYQSFKLKLVRGGFAYESFEESGGVSYVERATVKWSNVSGVKKPSKDGLSRWNTSLVFFEPVDVTRVDRTKTLQDELFESSALQIGFPTEDLARTCTRLLRSIASTLQSARRYPKVNIEVDGVLVPQIKEYARIIDGHTYARVCSVSEPLNIKMLTANYEEVWIYLGEEHFRFPVGEYRLLIGESVESAPLPPIQIGENVFFPLRFVAERIGATVKWDASARTVRITTRA